MCIVIHKIRVGNHTIVGIWYLGDILGAFVATRIVHRLEKGPLADFLLWLRVYVETDVQQEYGSVNLILLPIDCYSPRRTGLVLLMDFDILR